LSPQTRPLASLRNIGLRCGERTYFAGTDWDIRQGEHWAILGPNGSGKSLLASAIAGQVHLAQGQLTYWLGNEEVAGHDLGGSYARRGQVVLVSLTQQQALAARYAGYHQARWNSSESSGGPTVEDLLTYHSLFAINPFEVLPETEGEPMFEERRRRAIELLEMGPLLGRKVKQLSNGEARRLLLARALACAPRLLVLDDPFAGLDRAGRERLRVVLGEVAGEATIVIATARRDEIPSCVTHVLEIDAGNAARRVKVDRAVTEAIPFQSEPSVRSPAQPLGEPLVEMSGVSVRYGDALILDAIDFSLRRGEHCALLGPNGSGKSTLLSLLLGDNPQAYANDIRLFGRARGTGESIWDIKSRIGWVAPELLMHYPPGWACLDVALSGFFASIGLFRQAGHQQEDQARRALAWMGLASVGERPLQDLSHGHQRLVLLARALVANPDLVVLDEPCQGLDPEHTTLVNRAIDRIAQELPISTIYVSHHEDELPLCITRILRLEQGRITS
jgi:molybdate transport system ATP-binding protein